MLYHITKVTPRPLAFASRVLKTHSTSQGWTALYVASRRSYAATTAKPRAAAKSTTASKATQTKKATPAKKTVAAKKSAKKPAKKPVKKPVTKARKKKPVVKKVVKKRGSRLLSKKVLLERERDELKELKEAALLVGEPPKHSKSSWHFFLDEVRASPGDSVAGNLIGFPKQQAIIKEAAKRFKELQPAEIERLNHKARQEKEEDQASYKKWVTSYTPEQIRRANNARRLLHARKQKKAVAQGKPVPAHKNGHLIVDDRQPKRNRNAYAYFTKDRWASNDFKSLSIADAAKLMGQEWKNLDPVSKKPFQDMAEADLTRFTREKQTVFQ